MKSTPTGSLSASEYQPSRLPSDSSVLAGEGVRSMGRSQGKMQGLSAWVPRRYCSLNSGSEGSQVKRG